MTDKKRFLDNGPAFPIKDCPTPWGNAQAMGLSQRDWFAGQALAGMFRHDGWINTIDDDQVEVAKRAYAIADAMLIARKGGEA